MKPRHFFAMAFVFLILAPITQAAKTLGPLWQERLINVPTTIGLIGLVMLAAGAVVWVWTVGDEE